MIRKVRYARKIILPHIKNKAYLYLTRGLTLALANCVNGLQENYESSSSYQYNGQNRQCLLAPVWTAMQQINDGTSEFGLAALRHSIAAVNARSSLAGLISERLNLQ